MLTSRGRTSTERIAIITPRPSATSPPTMGVRAKGRWECALCVRTCAIVLVCAACVWEFVWVWVLVWEYVA